MDYGFEINGIIGIDFLEHIGEIIDLNKMLVYNWEKDDLRSLEYYLIKQKKKYQN